MSLTHLPVNADTERLIAELDTHLSVRPPTPPDYAVYVDHLRIEMDRWAAQENALRVVLGERLVTLALGAYAHGYTIEGEGR